MKYIGDYYIDHLYRDEILLNSYMLSPVSPPPLSLFLSLSLLSSFSFSFFWGGGGGGGGGGVARCFEREASPLAE